MYDGGLDYLRCLIAVSLAIDGSAGSASRQWIDGPYIRVNGMDPLM